MDWPTAIGTMVPVGVALVSGLRSVAAPVRRLATAAERIATRLEGADYVALPARRGRADLPFEENVVDLKASKAPM